MTALFVIAGIAGLVVIVAELAQVIRDPNCGVRQLLRAIF